MASSSINLFTLHKSHFLGQSSIFNQKTKPFLRTPSNHSPSPTAKFKLSEILGGRGLCNGEEGLQQELKKTISPEPSSSTSTNQDKTQLPSIENIPQDGFDKELLGLTGGFPGGETALQKFIEKNPPPKKSPPPDKKLVQSSQNLTKRPKSPVLPILMPGMIAIVKNPNNPYYMYCGIVQRITDGMAGVLFEGGNWDRLITFKLDELERREKGPPMVSPRSVVLETMIEQDSK